jgi:hypothetical protein
MNKKRFFSGTIVREIWQKSALTICWRRMINLFWRGDVFKVPEQVPGCSDSQEILEQSFLRRTRTDSSKTPEVAFCDYQTCPSFFFWGGGSARDVSSSSALHFFLFGSLCTGMIRISLCVHMYMQWPLTSQSHGSFSLREQLVFCYGSKSSPKCAYHSNNTFQMSSSSCILLLLNPRVGPCGFEGSLFYFF